MPSRRCDRRCDVYDGHMTDTYLKEDGDGGIAEREDVDGYAMVRNDCCGSPYPIVVMVDGREACAGCLRVLKHADACDCPDCEGQRFADDVADMSAER